MDGVYSPQMPVGTTNQTEWGRLPWSSQGSQCPHTPLSPMNEQRRPVAKEKENNSPAPDKATAESVRQRKSVCVPVKVRLAVKQPSDSSQRQGVDIARGRDY